MSGSLRLRQICLVAWKLAPVEEDLRTIFGIEPCHHSNLFDGRFGIHNVVFAVGGGFLEVAALHPGADPKASPAGRYLERRKGDGGYMVILECNDVPRRRAHMERLGVRIVLEPNHDGFHEIQLHPRDTGGALIAINQTAGRDGLVGPYPPAGREWWLKAAPSTVTFEMSAADLQGPDPEALAARWSAVLERPVAKGASGAPEMALDVGCLRFVPDRDGRGEGLGCVDMVVGDRQRVLGAAAGRGIRPEGDVITVCGTRFRLVQH